MSAKDEWQYKYNKSHNTLQCRPCGWLDGWLAIPPDKWINKIYNNMFHVQDINVGGQEAEGRRHHQSSNAELSWVMATFEAIASSLLLLLLLLLWWPLRVVCPVLGNTHIIWFYSNESYLGDRNWSLQWNEVEWSGGHQGDDWWELEHWSLRALAVSLMIVSALIIFYVQITIDTHTGSRHQRQPFIHSRT